MPSHRNCSVIGCSNSYYTILKWNKGHCSIHNDYFGLGRCVCLPPFKLFPFPKHFSTCVKWVQLLRRKEFKFTCHRRICSVHFIDGKPTEENPYPVIKMGYDDLPTAPSGMKCCIKQDVAPCSYVAKKKKKRKMQVDVNKVHSEHCAQENSDHNYARSVDTLTVTAKMRSSDGQPSTRSLRYCCARNCSRHARSIDSRTGERVKMFNFPNPIRDQDRCAKWIANLKRADLKLENILTKRVCSAHFEIKSYVCPTNIAESRLLPSAIPTRFDSPKAPNTKLGKSSKKLQNINSDSNLVTHPAKAKRGYVTEHSMPANTGTNKRKRRRTCADLDKVSANYGLHEGHPTATEEKYTSGSEIRFKNLRSKRIGGFICPSCKLIFTSRQEVDAHRQNDHKSQKRPIGAKTVECPDRQVLIKVSSDVKSLNAPVTKKVQEYSQLQLGDNCSGLNCLECRLPFGDAAHLRKYIICKLCRYATNCIKAYQDHVCSYHTGARKMKRARDRPMGHALHCACGFKSQFGDNVARHLVQCCKRTSYLMAYTRFLETEDGKPTPHILSRLALMKQGKKSPSEKSGSHKWKRVKINDVSTLSKVFLGSCDSESNLDEQSLVPSSPSGVSDYSATVRSPVEPVTMHTCDLSVSATPMDDNVNHDLNDGSNHSHKSARVSPSSTAEILSHKTCDSI